jgi:hypothetical protein
MIREVLLAGVATLTMTYCSAVQKVTKPTAPTGKVTLEQIEAHCYNHDNANLQQDCRKVLIYARNKDRDLSEKACDLRERLEDLKERVTGENRPREVISFRQAGKHYEIKETKFRYLGPKEDISCSEIAEEVDLFRQGIEGLYEEAGLPVYRGTSVPGLAKEEISRVESQGNNLIKIITDERPECSLKGEKK